MDYLSQLQFDLRFVNGQRLRVSANEIIELLYHRYMVAFYLAAILIIIALPPHDQMQGLHGTAFVLVYFSISFFSFFNFATFLIAVAWTLQGLGRSTVSVTATQFGVTLIHTWLASITIFEMALTGFGLTFGPAMLREIRSGDQAIGDSRIADMMETHFQAGEVVLKPDDPAARRWVPDLDAHPNEIVRAEAQQN
ncbi:hypothetical protein [Xinfangfangia pollutisoli]|uniref:hypothetical protein n=1 Tax=Xinfangfangia pollutisoli TaxID=2865960 RepID=UPI001CD21016|nr:hypothetical protein [Xinfangfangia pollutisoli]